jgi:uncharacterized membrane protein
VSPQAANAESEQISENIAAVHDFYTREEHKRTVSQRHAESIGRFVGRPVFLVVILVVVSVWIGANLAARFLGFEVFDEPPFFWLQGMVALAAQLTTTVVLIKQNRVDKLSEQRAHLDLKVTLLIEQKTAKLINLMEELRRDLPNVRHRHDPGSAAMQQAMSPTGMLAALDEEVISPDGSISTSTAAPASAAHQS